MPLLCPASSKICLSVSFLTRVSSKLILNSISQLLKRGHLLRFAREMFALIGHPERERILREARRTPDRELDGTATWSLTTLQRALRQADSGLPRVSTYTIFMVLHEAGFTWQASQTWCETGKVKRKRKSGVVDVIDPDAEPKKS